MKYVLDALIFLTVWFVTFVLMENYFLVKSFTAYAFVGGLLALVHCSVIGTIGTRNSTHNTQSTKG